MKFILAVILLLSITLPTNSQTCPKCYYDRAPPTGHGNSQDSLNRTQLNIRLDPSSLSESERYTLTPALDAAMDEWNNATNNSGQHIPYHFYSTDNDQEADFTIVKGIVAGGG